MNEKGKSLSGIAFVFAQSKPELKNITADSNAKVIISIRDLYIADMNSARASSGNYTGGVAGQDLELCGALYNQINK